MNFEELKKAAKSETAPETKETQSLIIVTTEDKGARVSVQTATVGVPMHLAQALYSILKDNPEIAQCMSVLSMQSMEKAAKKIEDEKNQAKYN
jgi:hypothetical protein